LETTRYAKISITSFFKKNLLKAYLIIFHTAMNIRHYDVFVDNNFVGRAFSTQYCLTCLPSGREALVTVVPVDELFNRLSPLTMNMNRMRMFN